MSVSLEQLIAVNDELAALVRAGLPLELGLRQVASDSAGRLRTISSDLAVALNRGESLPEALDSCGHDFPKAYRAIVEAGLRCRNLPRALEAVTGFARSALDVRRQVALALIYPAIVLASAYALFVAFLVYVEPTWTATLAGFHLQPSLGLQVLAGLRNSVSVWGPAVPIASLVLFGLWWWIEWRQAPGGGGLFGGRVFRQVHVANFAELLGILVEQKVPIVEALPLAAAATGDRALQQASEGVLQQVTRGIPLSEAVSGYRAFPPMLRWLMQARETSPTLAAALQQVAETYRARALSKTEWLRTFLPLLITLIVGGGATLIYSLTLFVPLTEFLQKLSSE